MVSLADGSPDLGEELLRILLDSSGSLYTDWKFLFGLVGMVGQLVVSTICQGRFNRKLGPNTKVMNKWIEVVSFDLIALSLIQCHSGAGIWIFLLMAFVYNSYWMLEAFCKAKHMDKFPAFDIYEDLRRPGFMVGTVFLGQCLLFIMYLVELFEIVPKSVVLKYGTMDGHYTYWVCGVVAIQMSAMFGRGNDSQVGKNFNGRLWGVLYQNLEHLTLVNENDDRHVSVGGVSFYMRMFMAFSVNAVMRDVIAYTTPLVLMVNADNILDFIQNGLAIVFITQLNTTSEGGVYRFRKRDENWQSFESGESSFSVLT